MTKKITDIGIIGSGSLGTALAQNISKNVNKVFLYTRRETLSQTINKTHYNTEYYPNTKLNDNIISIYNLNKLNNCKIIFLAIPSSAFRQTLENLKEIINEDTILVTTAKGIEYPSLKTMGELVSQINRNYVVLSGPNFASEIILDLPTITNLASNNNKNAIEVKKVLSTPQFKVKIIDDVKGLEMCGIIKNINAIANGICEGMNINENARYAVLTKGFEETTEIIKSIGGKSSTANDYCGFGDLIMTSTSSESRNHTLGMLYGQRLIVDEKASGIVFEGKNSIKAMHEICKNNNIDSIIINFVYDILINNIPPKLAFNKLWELIG